MAHSKFIPTSLITLIVITAAILTWSIWQSRPQPQENNTTLVLTQIDVTIPTPGMEMVDLELDPASPRKPSNVTEMKPLADAPDPSSPQDEIHAILGSAGDDKHKALAMLKYFSYWPEAAQVEAAQHMVNLMDDKQFQLLYPILLNPQSEPGVMETIMDDLLMRPEEIRLPLLQELARYDVHPLSEEAASLLAFYLE